MNLRPSGYEPDELPDCSTPHQRRRILQGQPHIFKITLKPAVRASLEFAKPQRLTFRSPVARFFFKYPGTNGATGTTFAFLCQVPATEPVPVTLYRSLATSGTVGAATLAVMNITGIDMVQAIVHGNFA